MLSCDCGLSVLGGCFLSVFFEDQVKRGLRIESGFESEGKNCIILVLWINQKLLCLVHAVPVDEVEEILMEFLVQNLGKVSGRDFRHLREGEQRQLAVDVRLLVFDACFQFLDILVDDISRQHLMVVFWIHLSLKNLGMPKPPEDHDTHEYEEHHQ